MKELFNLIGDIFKELFGGSKATEEIVVSKYQTLKYGSKGKDVLTLKQLLANHSFDGLDLKNENFLTATEIVVREFQKYKGLVVDGVVGPKTWAALESTPDPKAAKDYMAWAEKYKGKKETNKSFSDWLSSFWPKWFGAKTIVGSAVAWCGLWVFVVLSQNGYQNLPEGYITAKKWDGYGHAVDWKKDGIARGTVLRLNSSGDCKSAKGNHVTFANGYCTPQDLTKSGATIGGYGGNQSDSVKVSIYRVSTICYAGWPKELGTPPKVTKSNNCTGSGPTDESTR